MCMLIDVADDILYTVQVLHVQFYLDGGSLCIYLYPTIEDYGCVLVHPLN